MSFENRRWIFLNTADISAVNFNQVIQNDQSTVRKSLDGSKFFVKYETSVYKSLSGDSIQYEGDELTEINSVSSVEGEYPYNDGDIMGRPDCFDLALEIDGKIEFNHEEVLDYLATAEWSNPEQDLP